MMISAERNLFPDGLSLIGEELPRQFRLLHRPKQQRC